MTKEERENNLVDAAIRTVNYYGVGAFGTDKLKKALDKYSIEELENAQRQQRTSQKIT